MAEQQIRWYVRRIERYIRAHPGKAVNEHRQNEVRDYLEKAGRDPRISGWLFRQLVHALQVLHRDVIGIEWPQTFDWKFWFDSARTLGARHPTLVRHNHPAGSRKPSSECIESADRSSEDLERDLTQFPTAI